MGENMTKKLYYINIKDSDKGCTRRFEMDGNTRAALLNEGWEEFTPDKYKSTFFVNFNNNEVISTTIALPRRRTDCWVKWECDHWTVYPSSTQTVNDNETYRIKVHNALHDKGLDAVETTIKEAREEKKESETVRFGKLSQEYRDELYRIVDDTVKDEILAMARMAREKAGIQVSVPSIPSELAVNAPLYFSSDPDQVYVIKQEEEVFEAIPYPIDDVTAYCNNLNIIEDGIGCIDLEARSLNFAYSPSSPFGKEESTPLNEEEEAAITLMSLRGGW